MLFTSVSSPQETSRQIRGEFQVKVLNSLFLLLVCLDILRSAVHVELGQVSEFWSECFPTTLMYLVLNI